MKVGKFYGISLKDSLYKIKDIKTASIQSSIRFIAFAFKIISKLSEDVTIFINETGTRGVTLECQINEGGRLIFFDKFLTPCSLFAPPA